MGGGVTRETGGMSRTVSLPSTAAVDAALEVASAYHSPAMLNHCIRSYLWATARGEQLGLEVDEELLAVAALLHDIGLVPEFDNHRLEFEHAGGHVARVFAAGAGWGPARRERVGDVIVRHMWNEVDPAVDAEGHLLCVATGLDISGRDSELWPASLRTAVLERYPRSSLRDEFVGCLREQASRKPSGAAADALASGIDERMSRNPLEPHHP